MSNSREQSLDENVVFLPVDESNPEFLHSEREREAVERLLSEGPEAFYGSIGSELSRCFLSPEEVNQINSCAQKYQFNQKPLILKVPGSEDFSSVSDIMRRMKLGTTDLLRRGKGSTMSERTQSMMDLMDPSSGLGYKGQQERSVPRFQGNLDPDHMTPALALMTKRNNESLSYLNRPPKLFPHLRPQNSTNDHINRRWSLAEVKEYK
uniref:Family with sequence similarity 83, member E n=1 Tax=Nothobranchius furzeri TaxID=105023 RepID=A0A1A8ATH5_NOTFU